MLPITWYKTEARVRSIMQIIITVSTIVHCCLSVNGHLFTISWIMVENTGQSFITSKRKKCKKKQVPVLNTLFSEVYCLNEFNSQILHIPADNNLNVLKSRDIRDFPSPCNMIESARLPANKTSIPTVPAWGRKICARLPGSWNCTILCIKNNTWSHCIELPVLH